MGKWVLILILAIIGTVLVAIAAVGLAPAPYSERGGWVGAGLVGLAVCLIAAANVG